jgi:xanthine dehydrogenase molybdopterin-binding subunit B
LFFFFQVDIGQVEGAFVMGLGLWTSEEVKHDPITGDLLTKNTWVNKKHRLFHEIGVSGIGLVLM